MGFYGNVSSTNKTAFSFDITYSSRTLMENNAQTDGVFIGRYVLVEYDTPPISAYYNPADNLFYNTSNYGTTNLIKAPKDGQIYLDISQDHSPNPFYMWKDDGVPTTTIYVYQINGVYYASTSRDAIPADAQEVTLAATGAYVKVSSATSPYTMSYNLDVTNYGRGYDSTAWRKTYDTVTNKYRYVLVSELNTVVPNFHLIADPPSNVPSAPYFDRDTTTNIDYFLHDQAAWGTSIRAADKKLKNEVEDGARIQIQDRLDNVYDLSDEQVVRVSQTWSQPDDFGSQYVSAIDTSKVPGDIYYNKIGFDRTYHHITPQTDGKSAFENTINYEVDHSGRLYYDTVAVDGTWKNGETKPDVMEWYIHLPILGDAVCELWDTLYSYDQNIAHYEQSDTHLDFVNAPRRYTDLATRRGDTGFDTGAEGEPVQKRYITYKTNSALGAINEMRDMLGYSLKSLTEIEGSLSKIDSEAMTITDAVDTKDATNIIAAVNNVDYTFDKENTMYLYYTPKADTDAQQEVKEHFFAYAYAPQFVPVTYDAEQDVWYYLTDASTRREFDESDLYYLDTDNVYKKVNRSNYGIELSNGERVEPIATFYAPLDRWKLTEVDNIKEDSVYGLITRLHELLGDANPTLRTLDTIAGCINILRDMIKNIDTQLQPHRLVMTNDHGQIVNMLEYDGQTFGNSVEYPYFASQDRQEILDCGGHWRLPVTYKLETLDLSYMNRNTNRYFDVDYNGKNLNNTNHNGLQGYYGNSCLHAVLDSDNIGEAIKKMQHEMADIQYQVQAIDSFTVSLTNGETNSNKVRIENGRAFGSATLTYKLNKGPRQAIKVERIAPTPIQTIYTQENIDKDFYVVNPSEYEASASGTLTDDNNFTGTPNSTITWQISVLDERDALATKTVSAKYASKVYSGVGDAISDLNQINTYQKLTNVLSQDFYSKLLDNKANANYSGTVANQKYFYYMQPASWNKPTFKIGGFEGGLDELTTTVELLPANETTWTFTNEYGYSTAYRVWRSTNTNLGALTVAVS